MWAGARTNYGFNKGKIAFEFKVRAHTHSCKSAKIVYHSADRRSLLVQSQNSESPIPRWGLKGSVPLYGVRKHLSQILEHLNVDHLPPEETSRHVVRAGFSTDATSLQLGASKCTKMDKTNDVRPFHRFKVKFATLISGEEPFSYGFGGTGKASTDCKFTDYGETFGEGDAVGCFLVSLGKPIHCSTCQKRTSAAVIISSLVRFCPHTNKKSLLVQDMDAEPHVISFTKNGVDLGTCFEVEKESLAGAALFPHVLSKNCELQLNFGQLEEPFFPLKEGFEFVGKVAEEERVRGTLPPEKKEDCEVGVEQS